MTSIFQQEPRYITVEEVKDSTEKTEIAVLSDDDIEILIYKSELAIDRYMNFKADVEAMTEDEEQDYKIATLYCVEQVFTNWDTITSVNTAGWGVIEESVGDRRVKYSEWKTSNNINQLLGIPDVAKSVLDKYKRSFYKQTI